jgi:hypothetical protein
MHQATFLKHIIVRPEGPSTDDIWLELETELPFAPTPWVGYTLGDNEISPQSVGFDIDRQRFYLLDQDETEYVDAIRNNAVNRRSLDDIVQDYRERGWRVIDCRVAEGDGKGDECPATSDGMYDDAEGT